MVQTRAVASILGLAEVSSMGELDGAVARGLSKAAVERVVARLARDRKEARSIRDQVVPPATWKRTKERLSAQASERTERLARVLAAAEYAWDDAEQAKVWMAEPHAELEGKTPRQAASTELGARAVEEILDRLVYGLPA